MIATLKGVVTEKETEVLVIEVNGVGYGVMVTDQDRDDVKIGQTEQFYVSEHIREAAHDLYGFRQVEAKGLFELLLTVSGVGPKMALAIVNLGDVKTVEGAIGSSNILFLSSAAGVGKRLAERIAVDLQDKVGHLPGAGEEASADDAWEALKALGYNSTQIRKALAAVPKGTDKVEDRVKVALKELGK